MLNQPAQNAQPTLYTSRVTLDNKMFGYLKRHFAVISSI